MSFLCKIGLHKWKWVQEGEYGFLSSYRKCGRSQCSVVNEKDVRRLEAMKSFKEKYPEE